MNKKLDKGNYICKVHFYDIYMKRDFKGSGKERKMVSHAYDIYHAKRKLEGGFKTKEEAIEKANELFTKGTKSTKF